jgi:pilus assembly protein CpaE
MAKDAADLLLLGVPLDLEQALAGALEGVGEVTGSVVELGRFDDLLHSTAPPESQIVLVDVDADPEAGFEAVRQLSSPPRSRPVVVLSQSKDSDQVLRAMRAGAREYAIVEPDLKEVVGAVINLAREHISKDVGTGKVITVFGAKGGCGATAVATNLAGMARSKRDLKVVLVDLNLELGDCLVFLDLANKFSISDAIRNMQRLDAELLRTQLPQHSSGLHVLAQSDRVEEADHVTPEQVGQLLSFLKHNYDIIVVDGLRGFDEVALTALDASDQILLLVTQDIPAIKNARRCLDVFDRLGYQDKRIHVVVSRYEKGLNKLDVPTIVETLGRPVAAHVSNDPSTVMDGINRGALLSEVSPRARVTEDIQSLVAVALGRNGERPRKGGLRSLFARRGG